MSGLASVLWKRTPAQQEQEVKQQQRATAAAAEQNTEALLRKMRFKASTLEREIRQAKDAAARMEGNEKAQRLLIIEYRSKEKRLNDTMVSIQNLESLQYTAESASQNAQVVAVMRQNAQVAQGALVGLDDDVDVALDEVEEAQTLHTEVVDRLSALSLSGAAPGSLEDEEIELEMQRLAEQRSLVNSMPTPTPSVTAAPAHLQMHPAPVKVNPAPVKLVRKAGRIPN